MNAQGHFERSEKSQAVRNLIKINIKK